MPAPPPTTTNTRKRKRKDVEDEAIAKVKKGKEVDKKKQADKKKQKGKKKPKGSDDDSDDEYDDNLARDMYKKAPPAPGQLENCEICSKRFTVTPYTKTGPEGGLVCTPCGKELAAEAGPSKPKAKKAAGRPRRRKEESNKMDNLSILGAKTLQQMCIEKVADHHQDVEEFGDLPQTVLERLGEIFTKKRIMDPRTMKLFLRSDHDSIAIHDCAKLETEDYHTIFAVSPHVEKVVLRNTCQFKDETMEYMIEKGTKITYLQLYAANLVSDAMWHKLFQQRGQKLETLKLQWLDASFEDEAVEEMSTNCPNLQRLKLKLCRRIGAPAIDSISRLTKLEHLSLRISQDVPCERLVNLIGNVGRNLRTLSLEQFPDANDTLLEAIHAECRNLTKFRLTENDYCTDAGFAELFADWANLPLLFADFSSTRDIDNNNPDGPEQAIGLADQGLAALMQHSGTKLRHLDIASCRHISHAAFTSVFDGRKQYPALESINLSFCGNVDTVVVAGILKSCPALKKVIAFGCFNIEDVVVPRGVVLIGVPKARDFMIEQVGMEWVGLDAALGAMVEAVGAA